MAASLRSLWLCGVIVGRRLARFLVIGCRRLLGRCGRLLVVGSRRLLGIRRGRWLLVGIGFVGFLLLILRLVLRLVLGV